MFLHVIIIICLSCKFVYSSPGLHSPHHTHTHTHTLTHTLTHTHIQCSFMEYKNYKVVYRRYASLYFIIGIDNSEVSFLLCSCKLRGWWSLYVAIFVGDRCEQNEISHCLSLQTLCDPLIWTVNCLIWTVDSLMS